MTSLQHARIAELCEQLKLDRLASEWPALAHDAAHKESAKRIDALLRLSTQLYGAR